MRAVAATVVAPWRRAATRWPRSRVEHLPTLGSVAMRRSSSAPRPIAAATLVDRYLEEQQVTAAARFSEAHDAARAGGAAPALAGRYSALMPATPPAPGQQYAFDVDLDACSGCKSCVAACHSLAS